MCMNLINKWTIVSSTLFHCSDFFLFGSGIMDYFRLSHLESKCAINFIHIP